MFATMNPGGDYGKKEVRIFIYTYSWTCKLYEVKVKLSSSSLSFKMYMFSCRLHYVIVSRRSGALSVQRSMTWWPSSSTIYSMAFNCAIKRMGPLGLVKPSCSSSSGSPIPMLAKGNKTCVMGEGRVQIICLVSHILV